MKRRRVLMITTTIVVLAVLMSLGGAVVGFSSRPRAGRLAQETLIPDLSTLLNYPYDVHIEELIEPERTTVLNELMGRPETLELMTAMANKGFSFDTLDPTAWEVMRITVYDEAGFSTVVSATTTSMIENELSAALTAMVANDGNGFFQAHHTNLDPNLAQVPDPPIVVNGMPYFYITTLRWINGRIIYWRYWWYDSHHHPNWYYSHYYWYWWYYRWHDVRWPYWYWWVHGWCYWRYWYYWSTWFPWLVDYPIVGSEMPTP